MARIDGIYDSIQDYLETALSTAVTAFNRAENINLPQITEYDRGYKDIALGIRKYPAVLMLEARRAPAEAYYGTLSLSISIAVKSTNLAQLESWGRAFTDILEDVLLEDHTLGGTCLDVHNIQLTSGETSNVYLVMAEFDMEVDRGG